MELQVCGWQIHSADLLGDKAAISVFLAIAVVITTFLWYFLKTKDLPPGPVGLPLLGYAPFLKGDTCHLTLQEMQKKYGDIFSFNFAGTLYINMGSVKVVREININKADCFDKSLDFSILTFMLADGIGFINGEPWKVLKKFTVQQFKELGMTTIKDNLSGPIYDSIKETIEFLKSKKGEPAEIVQLLTDKCNTVLRRTLFADCGITEREVREIYESYGVALSLKSLTNFLYFGNVARYFILPFKSDFKEAMKHHKIIKKLLFKVVNDHKSRFNEEHPRDFIDAYFKERNERRKRCDPTAEYFTDKALVATLIQIVGDSVITIAHFVSLFLKYVVEHEEEQEKIYAELIEVVGHGRAPTIDDKSKLQYTNAFILEVMRTADFFVLFPSQECIKETTVRGYKIPKGAITLLNFWACHNDPNVYEEPDKFDPSRFISKDGKQRAELPVTFGVGKRSCMGEGFTMAQVFLYLTTIIQNFKLTIPESLKIKNQELLISGKMEVCAQPRS